MRMLGAPVTRVLGERDLDEALAVIGQDPVANVFVASRCREAGLDPQRLGGELWGYHRGGRLESLCFSGANLIPVQASIDAVHAFAELARRQGRRCSSIVGPADPTSRLWNLLRPYWGPARDVRLRQPLMATSVAPPEAVRPDPRVRLVRPVELPMIVPASVAMFTEEIGVCPLDGEGGAFYRTRVEELVESDRAYALFEHGRVVFKAEIGVAAEDCCQIQGVWVAPDRRGQGLGIAGMAAVVEHALRDHAPVVSLYVNDYNLVARAVYRRVGFTDVGTFASVLF